jgi:D-arabinose 1-dehydrogenase-like Zn-dependent alcohol dehydrogenase
MVRAAVMTAPNAPIEVREFPLPALEEGAILLRTVYSEVCGTDVHLHQGHLGGVPYPVIPGHVNVGEIVDIQGTPVDLDGRPLRTGQVVTFLDVHETCGHCWFCTVAKPRRAAPIARCMASPTPPLRDCWAVGRR